MEIGTPSVQAGTEGLGAAGRAATSADALITGQGAALWGGVGGFIFVFAIVMFLIIRGRVIKPARHKSEKPQSTFFEPAGDDAEITFDDPDAEAPQARRGKKSKPKKQKKEKRGRAAPTPEPEPEPVAAAAPVFEDPDYEEDTRAGLERRPAPFAGIFEKSGAAPGREEFHHGNDHRAYEEREEEMRPHDGGDLDLAAIERERYEREEAEERRRRDEEEAAELARIEYERAEYEREETQRRAEAEARARQEAEERDHIYRAAREEAAREAEFERRKAEAALEQRMQSVAAMQRKLAEKAESLKTDAESVSTRLGATLEERFESLAAELDARIDAARREMHGGGRETAQELAAEFAQRLAAETEAIRASTDVALEEISARIDKLGKAQEGTGALAAELARLNALLAERSAAAGSGRVHLSDLVRSALPAGRFIFAKKLTSGRTADCLITMPGLAAPVAVDASYPADAYDTYVRTGAVAGAKDRSAYQRAALRHIVDVAENLIIPGETADFAIMFTPSEAIFNDLYTNFPDLVQDSYRARVWILSPTSMMSSLHMMSAVTNAVQSGGGQDLAKLEARIAALESKRAPAQEPGAAKRPMSPEEEAFERLQKAEELAESGETDAPQNRPPFPLR